MIISERELKKLKIQYDGVHFTQFYLFGLIPGAKWVGCDTKKALRTWCRWMFTVKYHV